MAQETTHVRLRKATVARLNAEIDRMRLAYEAGRQEVLEVTESSNPQHRGITVDALVNRLLDFHQQYRERRKRSARRAVREDTGKDSGGADAKGGGHESVA